MAFSYKKSDTLKILEFQTSLLWCYRSKCRQKDIVRQIKIQSEQLTTAFLLILCAFFKAIFFRGKYLQVVLFL